MTTKIFTRLALTAATTLAATGVMTAQPEGAAAATFTVNGTQWDITTVTGSYPSLLGTPNDLTQQPWWGNDATASAFAAAVGDSLGKPNNGGTQGPYLLSHGFLIAASL